MSAGPVIDLASGYLQSLVTSAVKGSSRTKIATLGVTQNTNQLSPFAQVLSSLQQLEQTNSPAYQQVTQRIATNLQTASQSATSAGDTTLGSQLTKLSMDFQNASASGQLPNVPDLAQAIGVRSHLHHAVGASNAHNNKAGNLSEFLQSLNVSQTGATADSAINALSIIDNTLSSAGIQIS